MPVSVMIKAFVIWLCILALAVGNGILREAVLMPHLAQSAAYVLSGLLLCAVVIAAAYVWLPWLRVDSPFRLWLVGLFWLMLTLVFEFGFGLWQGKSWAVLMQAYTFKGGNLWPLVLAVTAAAPYIAARLRGLV